MGKRNRNDIPVSSGGAEESSSAQSQPQSLVSTFERVLGVSLKEFFDVYHEKKPLLLQRGREDFYSVSNSSPTKAVSGSNGSDALKLSSDSQGVPIDWSTAAMREIVSSGCIRYGTDVNVVRFDPKIQKRVPYKTEGLVSVADFEMAITKGWSLRFLRPHEHKASISHFISEMEGLLGCFCGANSYWTPASSQGFAPHYDDVDVFLLQLEGEKRWRLYAPPRDEDELARISSEDYFQSELPAPTHDFVLKPGDMLYMPRGTVHQGVVIDTKQHSLHITFSAYQLHTYADFMKVLMERHLECLARSDLQFRRGLPPDWDQVLGAVGNSKLRHEELDLAPHSPSAADRRKHMLHQVRQLAGIALQTLQSNAEAIDFAADKFAAEMIAKRQPIAPVVSATRPPLAGDRRLECSGLTKDQLSVQLDMLPDEKLLSSCHIAVVDPHAVRLVLLDTAVEVVHCSQNSTICYGTPVGKLQFERCFAPAIATILTAPSLSVSTQAGNKAASAKGSGYGVKVDKLPFPEFESEDDIRTNQLLLVKELAKHTAFLLFFS
jgi:lysine-specific demethylase/histidyl-hydroxylase NO66